MGLEVLSFWIIAIITLGSALAVVLSKNIVYSALSLIVTFLGVAGMYLLLKANFLAAVQVLVYAGAIAIILVFGVMLTRKEDISNSNLFSEHKLFAALIASMLSAVIGRGIWLTNWEVVTDFEATVNSIATVMLSQHFLSFEMVAILLLVAMIGAIVLAKKEGQQLK